jgi:hypothetical protein
MRVLRLFDQEVTESRSFFINGIPNAPRPLGAYPSHSPTLPPWSLGQYLAQCSHDPSILTITPCCGSPFRACFPSRFFGKIGVSLSSFFPAWLPLLPFFPAYLTNQFTTNHFRRASSPTQLHLVFWEGGIRKFGDFSMIRRLRKGEEGRPNSRKSPAPITIRIMKSRGSRNKAK